MKTPATERTLLEGILHHVSTLLKYRWLIIGTTTAVVAAAVVFSVVSLVLPPDISPLPNKFTAQAILLVQSGTQNALATSILSSLGIETGTSSPAVGFDSGALLNMVLHSRTFLDKVIEEFGIVGRYRITGQVKTRARKLLQGKMVTSYDRTTASITISFVDIDPVFARNVTNRIVSLLSEWYAQNLGSSNMQQKKMLEEKVREVKEEIETLERQLKVLQNRYGVLTAQELGTSRASSLAELRSQLILKEIDIKNYSTFSAIEDPRLQQLREERQNILDLIASMQAGVSSVQGGSTENTRLSDVQMEFNNLTVELDVQRRIYNTLSPQYEALKLTSEPEEAFQILELAEIPDAKSSPQRILIVAEASLIGLAVSVALSILLQSVAQIRRKPQEPVIPTKRSTPGSAGG